jgi:hypothetical protein
MIGWTPPDNETLKQRYARIGGVCGPSTIAAEHGLTIQEVLEKWRGVGLRAWRGFSPIKDLKETLTAFGYKFTYFRAGKAREFPFPRTTAILRIQWLKPDGTEYYWAAAGSHTHYVLMEKGSEGWWIYCNGVGEWFLRDGHYGQNYLKDQKGFVSSFLEISKGPEP